MTWINPLILHSRLMRKVQWLSLFCRRWKCDASIFCNERKVEFELELQIFFTAPICWVRVSLAMNSSEVLGVSLNAFQASVSLFMKGWYGLNNFKFDGDLELHLVVSVNSPHCLFMLFQSSYPSNSPLTSAFNLLKSILLWLLLGHYSFICNFLNISWEQGAAFNAICPHGQRWTLSLTLLDFQPCT